jgi:hypothetical protein
MADGGGPGVSTTDAPGLVAAPCPEGHVCGGCLARPAEVVLRDRRGPALRNARRCGRCWPGFLRRYWRDRVDTTRLEGATHDG